MAPDLFRKTCLATSLLATGWLGNFAIAGDFPEDPMGWPAVTSINKPWTRWWWLGSAVDKPNLTHELEDFAKTGLGGVEICPIYGAVGAEDRFLKFLSPGWMDMLAHTTTEAKRLGLGVDMTTGTGWPFGGPQVTPEIASVGLTMIREKAADGKAITLTLPKGNLQCLRAFPESGPFVDLAGSVKDGKLDWQPPAGKWNIVGLVSQSPIQKVKRAAPGGEGNVLDPFSPDAMTGYLAAFDKAFAKFTAPMPRAQFHDSFEYYAAEWTPAFLEKFHGACGYDLRDQLPAFAGVGDADTVSRVRADYRETLSELHLAYLQRWHDWAKSHGEITRNQAHGSPGNLLDHYAVSEIPETEIFKDVEESQIPMIRIAASAAHSKGDELVSSETFTWLGEHFQVTPEKLKDAADFVFLGGVNHILFHGIPYSPEDAKWPGWLFYASTNMGPNGGLWRDLSAFTGYLQRCQSILQQGQASSDVLLYFPIHDIWYNNQEKLPLFTMHNQDAWLKPTGLYKTSMELWNNGISFDYASGNMLSRATVRDGKLVLGGHAYNALVLPGVKRMPPEIMDKIAGLSAQGASLVVQDGWPNEVPGFNRSNERRDELLDSEKKIRNNVTQATEILPALASLGVVRETMTAAGLRFVRRTHAKGFHYFIANRSSTPFDAILPLAVPFKCAVVLDPWNPSSSGTSLPQISNGQQGIALRLEPGQSIIIRTFTDQMIKGDAWINPPVDPTIVAIESPWKIEFIEGGPILPTPTEAIKLGTWTTRPDPDVANFSGTARYTTTFDFNPPLTASCRLDLGRVANTARVTLNGKPVGISWCAPHIINVGPFLKTGRNQLEVEVTNLASNRIADLDRRKVSWKQFHEINFVNIDYKPFDASAWPALESGLIGPVKLLVSPDEARK
ncbi:MAG: glycosyl hydrolase [Luteolibacter sp.]|uniref:glycosyl hydrolase n=1 Tax=Luteolibacter sp. TaxID=1962973 RepID=UPI003265B34D